MYKNFLVQNYRGIKQVKVDNLTSINLITGLNDAGKTSLLEALFLHASGSSAGAMAIQVIRPSRGQDVSFGSDGMINPWESFFHNLNTDLPIELRAVTSSGNEDVTMSSDLELHQALMAGSSTGENRVAGENSIIIEVTGAGIEKRKYRQTFAVRSERSQFGVQSVAIDMRMDPAGGHVLSPAAIVRGAVGANLAAGYSELRKKSKGIDLLESLQLIDDRIEKLEVLVSDGVPQLHAEIDNILVPFPLLGDGPIALAQYIISMSSARDGILLIDEIGSGIHHSALKKMWKALHRASQRLNVQIFATTHSAECLDAARETLLESRDLSILRIRRGRHDSSSVATYGGRKLAAAYEMNVELR